MEDFVKRIIEEKKEVHVFYVETSNRLFKLKNFLESDKYKELDATNKSMLNNQRKILSDVVYDLINYIDILNKRLNYLGDDKK